MTIEKYLENRRTWEILIATGILLTSFFANLGVVWIEFARESDNFNAWVPWVLEGTSHVGLAAVIPMILWFDHHFPIRSDTWRVSLPAHAVFSVVASLAHVSIMYGLRVGLYRAFEPSRPYYWENWLQEFGYEYLKDFRTYMLVVIFLYLYRFIIRRLQGEAGYVSEGQEDRTTVSDRFLVKKFGREFLVRIDEIEWIESAGNYVNLHVGGRVYPLRDTMTSISDKLAGHGFQRVHRTAIVNLDQVAEIEAFDTGDGQARLLTDITVPVSRRFKKELRERLA